MTSRNVLLISANTERIPVPVYPVALARLAGALEGAGHRVRQFDLLVHGMDSLPRFINESKPDVVGISIRNIDNIDANGLLFYLKGYEQVVKEVKKHTQARMVLGGSGFSIFPRQLLAHLDVKDGIAGVGEAKLCELVSQRIDGSQDPSPGIPSVGMRTGVCLHDPEIVAYYWRNAGMIGIQTKRGCPRKCTYCTYPLIEGREVNFFDVEEVVDEMALLKAEMGISHFAFVDSVFNLGGEEEIALAEEICRRPLGVSWTAFFSPAQISGPYLELLKRSGLTHVEFGTESLSDTMLKSYAKGFTAEEAVEASALCRKTGLHTAHYLLFGGPGETRETVAETVTNTRRMEGCAFFPFAGVRIYPGTRIHAIALKEKVIREDDDCFVPRFYLSEGLKEEEIWEIVREGVGESRAWVPPSNYGELAQITEFWKLRGFKGPLWEHLI